MTDKLPGIRYPALWHRVSWCRGNQVNYIAKFVRVAT